MTLNLLDTFPYPDNNEPQPYHTTDPYPTMETISTPYHSANTPLSFGFDINDLETTYPVIVAGPYRATVSSVEMKDKVSGDGQILRVVFQVDDEAKTETGATLPGGMHRLSKSYSLDPEHAQFLVRLHDAVHGSKKGSRPPMIPAQWQGKQVLLDVGIDPERVDQRTGKEFPRGNSVKNTSHLRQ